MQIHYEPHPVTAERKAELRAKGFKIIDARYAPEALVPLEVEATVSFDPRVEVGLKPKKRGRPRKAD